MITVKDAKGYTAKLETAQGFKVDANGCLLIAKGRYGSDYFAAYGKDQWKDVVLQENPVHDTLDLEVLAAHKGPLYVTSAEYDELQRRSTIDYITKNGQSTSFWNDRQLHSANRLPTEELIHRSMVLASQSKEEIK